MKIKLSLHLQIHINHNFSIVKYAYLRLVMAYSNVIFIYRLRVLECFTSRNSSGNYSYSGAYTKKYLGVVWLYIFVHDIYIIYSFVCNLT